MEGDDSDEEEGKNESISIHSLRMEGDIYHDGIYVPGQLISIHSLRMEGDDRHFRVRLSCDISIHSLRMEGDLCTMRIAFCFLISIHSLRMEGDRGHIPA